MALGNKPAHTHTAMILTAFSLSAISVNYMYAKNLHVSNMSQFDITEYFD
jgi:hypothetical protein